MSYSECEVNFIRRACPIDHVCQCRTVEHWPNLVYDTFQIEVRVYIHDIYYYPLIVLKLHRAIPIYELIVASVSNCTKNALFMVNTAGCWQIDCGHVNS